MWPMNVWSCDEQLVQPAKPCQLLILCLGVHFSLSGSGWQIVRHGGALGLGLAALGTARQDVYDLLKSNLYQDDAVTGV